MMMDQGQWHLKKEVSIVTLVLLLANIGGLVSLFVKLDSRVESLERQAVTDARIVRLETKLTAESELRAALERRTLSSLEEIKGLLRELSGDLRERDRERLRQEHARGGGFGGSDDQ